MKLWEASYQDETKAGTKNLSETTLLLRSRIEWRKESLKRDKLWEFKEISTRHCRRIGQKNVREENAKREK